MQIERAGSGLQLDQALLESAKGDVMGPLLRRLLTEPSFQVASAHGTSLGGHALCLLSVTAPAGLHPDTQEREMCCCSALSLQGCQSLMPVCSTAA